MIPYAPWNAPWNFVGERIWTSLEQTRCACLGNAFLIKIAFGFDEQGILGEHCSSSLLHLNPSSLLHSLGCCGDTVVVTLLLSTTFRAAPLVPRLIVPCWIPFLSSPHWQEMVPSQRNASLDGDGGAGRHFGMGGQNPSSSAKAVVQQSMGSFLCFPEGN